MSEDENWQFEYDVNGNLVRKTFKSSGLTWRYGYSVYDELVSATQHNGPDVSSPVLTRVAYMFDALGRRVAERKFDGTGAATGGINLSHDGQHLAHEVTLDAAVTSRWYTHRAAGATLGCAELLTRVNDSLTKLISRQALGFK